MERLWSTVEKLLSPETAGVIKEKAGEGLELVVRLSTDYKLVLVGAGAVVGLYWYATWTHGFFKKLGIPGPEPGLFGAMSQYKKFGSIPKYDQHIIEKYGKVVGLFSMRQPIYLVSDIDIIKQITVKEFSSFINRSKNTNFPIDPLFKESLVFLVDDHWKFIRGILSPTFTAGRMKEMIPLMQTCMASLVTNLWKTTEQGTKTVKMQDIFGLYSLDVIASTAFGIEADCQGDPENAFIINARKMTERGLKLIVVFMVCSLFPFLSKWLEAIGFKMVDAGCREFFTKAVLQTISDRRELNISRRDFLQLMLNSHKLEVKQEEKDSASYVEMDKSLRRGMTNDEILGNAMLFLFAGYETTNVTLAYFAYNLAINQDCQDRLIEEIDRVLNGQPPDYESMSKLEYLDGAYLETLRIFPPATRMSRMAEEDITINGVLFKKGVEVHFPVGAIHKDPENWPDPETYNPERFRPENRPENYNYVFLPFGAGPRNCIGMRFAHLTVKMAIAGILQKYRFVPGPETKIPPETSSFEPKPLDGMMLRIEKR
ncbi:cytochrome P450 3A24-like isoform X1 [Haliotis rufescens]|uniref:cytochrome P450 3A24-like isoform X1 n=1 Tax=Haliotis rufescens TaxID=6454 RepID=UPI00201EB1C3|nr:cytochrome P450 3A24-like isoform X1 [Haliotis rufescens]